MDFLGWGYGKDKDMHETLGRKVCCCAVCICHLRDGLSTPTNLFLIFSHKQLQMLSCVQYNFTFLCALGTCIQSLLDSLVSVRENELMNFHSYKPIP